MANSAVLFFRPRLGVNRTELEAALARALTRMQAQVPDAIVRGAVDAGLLGAETAHAQETSGGPVFAAVIHASLADRGDLLVQAVRGAAADFGQLIDPGRSAALAGDEHVVVPGEQRLMLAMAIRRLPSLTHQQYVQHWSTVHADLGRAVPGSQGYRQVRLAAPLSRQVAGAAGLGAADLDGVALAYYADEQAFFRIMGDKDVAGPLLADEQTFIDHTASALVCGWVQRGGTG
jgi:hypothetical protein